MDGTESGDVCTSWWRPFFHGAPEELLFLSLLFCADRLMAAISSMSSSCRTFCSSAFFSSSRIFDWKWNCHYTYRNNEQQYLFNTGAAVPLTKRKKGFCFKLCTSMFIAISIQSSNSSFSSFENLIFCEMKRLMRKAWLREEKSRPHDKWMNIIIYKRWS